MSLAKAIKEHDAWFHSKQDAFYSWFMGSGKESLQDILNSLSDERQEGDVKSGGCGKYILDVGDYSFLLVDPDGSAEKLSQEFELSGESADLEGTAVPVNIFVTVWKEPLEQVRFIPANCQYDFPVRGDNGNEALIDPLFLSAVDEVFEPHIEGIFSAVGDEGGEDLNVVNPAKDLLIGNLVKIILPLYYQLQSADLDENYSDLKEAYLDGMGRLLPVAIDAAVSKSKEDLEALLLDEDHESE
jgi:hypothetical protein